MPTYTGVCTYGEVYDILKQCFINSGWTVDDRTEQDIGYSLGITAADVWAVDSLYVYGYFRSYYHAHGRVVRKADRNLVCDVPFQKLASRLAAIARSDTKCQFNFTDSTNIYIEVPTPAEPYSFDTSQDTGIYFDDYYFIPTIDSYITMYYGGLFCTSPVGVTVGIIKTPSGLIMRPASLIPPYNSAVIGDHWPVQYLLKIEDTHVITVVQGIYQFDASARIGIGYTGLIKGDTGDPVGIAVVSTHQHQQQTQRVAVTNTVTDPSLPAYYIAQPATLLTSPNFDSDFMLSAIGLCRNGEGTRGTLYDIYACNIQAGTLLTGETITAPDGRKYTFFNVPTSQDGWYNGFHQNNGAWLAIRH